MREAAICLKQPGSPATRLPGSCLRTDYKTYIMCCNNCLYPLSMAHWIFRTYEASSKRRLEQKKRVHLRPASDIFRLSASQLISVAAQLCSSLGSQGRSVKYYIILYISSTVYYISAVLYIISILYYYISIIVTTG
jgi:hypothetical protein